MLHSQQLMGDLNMIARCLLSSWAAGALLKAETYLMLFLNCGQHNSREFRPCVSQGTAHSVGALERVSHRGDLFHVLAV